MIALIGAATVAGVYAVGRSMFGRAAGIVAGLTGVLLVAQQAKDMFDFVVFLAQPDSRILAYDWLTSQLRQGRRVATEMEPWVFCAPPFACNLPDVFADNTDITRRPPSWYADRGYDYLILVDKYSNVLDARATESDQRNQQVEPFKGLPRVQQFMDSREGGKGPYVVALKVGLGVDGMKGVARSGAHFGEIAELWGYAYAPIAKVDDYYDPAATNPPPEQVYKPGQPVGLSLYWRALKEGAAVKGKWTVRVEVVDQAGGVVTRLERLPVSSWHLRPLQQWQLNDFLAGVYNVPLPGNMLPGTYYIVVSVYDAPNGDSLPVIEASTAGTHPAPDLDIGTIVVH